MALWELTPLRSGNQSSAVPLIDDDISATLAKRIRKLRWIGMEHEAEQIEAELKLTRTSSPICVLGEPRDTD